MATRRIAILGSTGSIGTSALSVVDTHPDRLHVVALAAGNNVPVLAEQVRKYRPRAVALASDAALRTLGTLVDVPACAASGPCRANSTIASSGATARSVDRSISPSPWSPRASWPTCATAC